MTTEELKSKSKNEVMNFIRQRLSFSENVKSSMRYLESDQIEKQHKRFEMSGYESKTGECTVWNTSLLNEFADLGIYDYTSYLFLDFYKGMPTLYLKYFQRNEDLEFDEWSGFGTTEIIYEIFQLTILSDKRKRRRD
ncbi:hypothetical protein P700755_000758 [Psychroflexus torquis ATCC 700755]|jgi:hypothetical protein|uniref:Uncharacterized protein n=1 Tax=Psychroflexus torquis (strain ATCC 700755 / CIP 106069 / ACAM 623) TaxID=313595 RepID=K4IF92_PSYTT|nr:hypothetical protein [Psychroflexus torquis]AFU67761.1 hypothetical protein P700755_000758 [Psychroflexus torquis ATCC 700755]